MTSEADRTGLILGLNGVLTSLIAVNAGVHVRPVIAGSVMKMSTSTGKKHLNREKTDRSDTITTVCSTSVDVPYIKVKKFE